MPAQERARAVGARAGLAILLADRPTAGLDDVGRRAVLQALRSVARAGTTVLVDDVDPVAALPVADSALRVGADDLTLSLGEQVGRCTRAPRCADTRTGGTRRPAPCARGRRGSSISTTVPQWVWSPLTVMEPAWQVDSAL